MNPYIVSDSVHGNKAYEDTYIPIDDIMNSTTSVHMRLDVRKDIRAPIGNTLYVIRNIMHVDFCTIIKELNNEQNS
jgi:hypothetical protein